MYNTDTLQLDYRYHIEAETSTLGEAEEIGKGTCAKTSIRWVQWLKKCQVGDLLVGNYPIRKMVSEIAGWNECAVLQMVTIL